MKFLVDTNILSELIKPQPNQDVVQWAFRNESSFVVNPIVIGELWAGILLLPRGKRRERLVEWYKDNVEQLAVVDFDRQSATEWAELLAELRRRGKAMPLKDSLIAASARQHQLTLVTRNTADYRHASVKLLDPFHTS